jgi:hypothetical protein
MLSRDRGKGQSLDLYLRERELDMVLSVHSARSGPMHVDSISPEFALL